MHCAQGALCASRINEGEVLSIENIELTSVGILSFKYIYILRRNMALNGVMELTLGDTRMERKTTKHMGEYLLENYLVKT